MAYPGYEGSEQSAHPQLMFWPYNAVVKISSPANNSHKMSSLIFSEKNTMLSPTFLVVI